MPQRPRDGEAGLGGGRAGGRIGDGQVALVSPPLLPLGGRLGGDDDGGWLGGHQGALITRWSASGDI